MNCYKYSCLSLATLLITLNSAIAPSSAEIPAPQQVNAASSPVYVTRNNRREYTFKAPGNKT
ncbi:MAG: hypothetical protein AAFQ23_14280, partial [Cyanobacteria bacterium J06623_1]